ncbi:hypothetical protein MNBD_IGNAVI01-1621 [hydrothermal vent metagenome]|uniref:PorV/PorQ family protein n=1 Tax=hydrothermal vent metagenome TaxID=652676 RepID=A0A3B1C8I5_9ZZZZ
MKQLILLPLFLFSLNLLISAQGEGALPGQTLQRSLPLIGAGQIGAAKPNNDPIGYYLNPAILGYTSQNNHASLYFMPSKAEWIKSFGLDLTWDTFGFNIGFNLEEYDLPISVGFGYMHDKFSYGVFNGKESYDSFNNFSFGVGIDYGILLSFGMSIKPYESHLGGNNPENETISHEANGTAFDYGTMIIVPISKLLFNNVKWELSNTTSIKPTTNFTLGYSLTNVGDEIVYGDNEQADPISRTARLGYTIDFGFDAYINKNKLNIITYSFTAEVEDILIKQNETGFDGYQSFLGDIDVGKNLIQLKADDKVIVHKGHTINLFETLTITTGSFTGRGYPEVKNTNGYGFSSEGLLKLFSYSADNTTLNYIAKHFVVEYYDVTIFADWGQFETDMQGISLYMKNIEL